MKFNQERKMTIETLICLETGIAMLVILAIAVIIFHD